MAWKIPLATEDNTSTELLWSHNRGDFNAAQGAGGKNGATREITREALIGSAKKHTFSGSICLQFREVRIIGNFFGHLLEGIFSLLLPNFSSRDVFGPLLEML